MFHILKCIFNSNYREAVKIAKKANRIFAQMILSSKAVDRKR